MRFTDRSRTELDWTCPRARYWAYEFQGKGLVPLETPKELAFGLAMAEQTANIKQGKAWNLESFQGLERLVAKALLIGYEKIVWPRWLRDFDLVSIEEEQPKQLADWLTYNSRPDTIMRRKSDGSLWYGPEDKTTAWVDSLLDYPKNIQLHATGLCIEHNREEKLAGALVQGLYKGFEKEGKLYHPLVFAYCKEGIPGVVPDQWNAKWTRNWERRCTDEFEPGGMEGWILKQPEEVIAECFPMSPPTMLRRDLAEKYLKQVLHREAAVRTFHEQEGREMDVTFPQHFNQCDGFSKGRKPCQYRELCWNPTAARFPLTFYKHRTPHHANELAATNP